MKKAKWIFDECGEIERMQATGVPSEERESRWKALYDEIHDDTGWLTGPGEASLVGTIGLYLAAERSDFQTGRARIEEVLRHPEFKPEDPRVGNERYYVALAMDGGVNLACGDIETGVIRLRAVLSQNKWLQPVRALVREQITSALAPNPQATADPALIDLVREILLAGFGGKKRAHALADTATNAELVESLWKSL